MRYVWPLLTSYLWISGGMGWVYQHEATRGLKLTPTGKGIVVVASPLFTAFALVSTLVERVHTLFKRPIQ